ncbi:RHS repeat domain-containing protein [Chryseobacterium populi]|uniref:YD repeat-containing protein n=1 Tax=Chryseobacterium populi TaxID=1144316 RepID=J3CM33_9FLAO|nr:RHS repeat protein [Chryseobacterium populi]EJL74399.1 hypothetical protein PMI13_01138 [Chryseobacterium populi]
MKRYSLPVLMAVLAMGTLKSQNGIGQSNGSTSNMGQYTFQQLSSLKSPQTSDFAKYGNIPVNQFVGEPNFGIPLFNIKSSQLGDDISVSLGYNFSGFIPNKRPDMLGLNWFLNAGGVITREVRQIPDDHEGMPETNNGLWGINKDGLLVGLRSKSGCPPLYSTVGIFSMASNTGYFNSLDLDYRMKGCDLYSDYDGDADIFTFNFDGVNGKFVIGNDGQPKIIGEGVKGFKIDVTGVANQPITNGCKPQNSEIKITDNKGNEYYFGGESRNLEYTVPITGGVNVDEVRAGVSVISAWYLRKIIYSNTETVNFNYRDDSLLTDRFCHGTPGTVTDWHGINNANVEERKKFVIYNRTYNQDVSCVSTMGNNNEFACGGNDRVFSLTKKAILQDITTANYSIKFSYSLQPYIFNYESYWPSFFQMFKNVKLDSISLYTSGDKLINSFAMDYELKGGTTAIDSYPRMFLKSVTEQGKNPYLFTYNIGTENLPKGTSKQIDHWGYYNGRTANESMVYPVPTEATDSNGDYYFTNDTRDPDFTYSSKGILKSVTYPTKGTTDFEFEAPTYTYKILRKKVNGYMPLAYNVGGTAGGVRIKKIIDKTDGNIATEKQYTYQDGVLMQWPRYSMILNNNQQSFIYFRSSSMNMNILESSIINYGQVTENVTGSGSTITQFSNYLTHPDRNDTNTIVNSANPLSGSTDYQLALNCIGLYYNDMSQERGKVLAELAYDNLGKILRKTSYTYRQDNERFNDYTSVVHTSGPAAQANKIYSYPHNLLKKETTDYSYGTGQAQETTTKEDYSYSFSPDFQLTGTDTTFPDGTITRDVRSYAAQENNTLLLSKNMLAQPFENKVLKLQNASDPAGKVVAYSKDVYPTTTPTGSPILPESTRLYDAQAIASYTDVTYDKYDSKGNILQYTTKDGQTTGIVWGYNGTLPIAKIEGKDTAYFMTMFDTDITALRNASNNDVDETTENQFLDLLRTFQSRQFTLDVQITTYTHDPLVGITSITPPSGVRELYKYDTQGRLQKIVDVNGKTLKEFGYNYAQ